MSKAMSFDEVYCWTVDGLRATSPSPLTVRETRYTVDRGAGAAACRHRTEDDAIACAAGANVHESPCQRADANGPWRVVPLPVDHRVSRAGYLRFTVEDARERRTRTALRWAAQRRARRVRAAVAA